jgi:16S rRNA (uracil1498-N3)-methyltransferase
MEYYFTERNNIFVDRNKLNIKGNGYRHLIKVLRKKRGDAVKVTDGKLNVYDCEIDEIEKDKIICRILKKRYNINEPETSITLFLSHLKNMNRFELAVEKSVELGVKGIFPVITEYTVNKKALSTSRLNRLNGIIISAMEQSQRCFLPEIHSSLSFEELLNTTCDVKQKIAMYEFADKKNKININGYISEVALLIGPEGGLSNNEIDILKKNDWKMKSLGSRKFRAETAAIVSLYKLLN